MGVHVRFGIYTQPFARQGILPQFVELPDGEVLHWRALLSVLFTQCRHKTVDLPSRWVEVQHAAKLIASSLKPMMRILAKLG